MRRTFWYALIALVIAVFFLYLTARELPFGDVSTYLSSIDVAHLGLWSTVFVLLYSVCHWARVQRWYFLIQPIEPGVDRKEVSRVGLIGFGAILILPLRLGEFVRPALLAQKTKVSISAGLGTAVVERVVDGLVITGLLFVTLITYRGEASTGAIQFAGALSASIFVPAIVVCVAAYVRREWTMRKILWCAKWFPFGIGDKLAGMLDAFIGGLKGLVEGKALSRFLALSILYWGCNATSMWLLARFGFGLDVGLWDTITMMAVLVIGIMIPAGPAMAGNFEYFVMQAASLFVVLEDHGGAVGAFAGVLHVLQFLVIVIPALWITARDVQARGWWRLTGDLGERSVESS